MKKRVIGGILLTSVIASISLISAQSQFNIADVLNKWADIGVFSYMLPFLLIFALVYGILSSTNILGQDQKAVNAIIAVALGLLSLVGDYVPRFFQELAPNLGIALSVLLAAIILLGLFKGAGFGADWIKYVIIAVAIIAFIAVLISSFSGYPAYATNLWDEYGPALITLIILGLIIFFVVKKTGSSS